MGKKNKSRNKGNKNNNNNNANNKNAKRNNTANNNNKHGKQQQHKLSKAEERKKRKELRRLRNQQQYMSGSGTITLFKQQLNASNLQIHTVMSDGNCLFRSISKSMYDDENRHAEVRATIVSFMRELAPMFEPFICDGRTFDEYLDEMSQDKEWGGHLEIQAASMALHINLSIYQWQHPRYDVINNPLDSPIIRLSYHDGEHYNSIRVLDDQKPYPTFDNNVNSADHTENASKQISLKAPNETEKIIMASTSEDLNTVRDALEETGNDMDAAIEYIFAKQFSLEDQMNMIDLSSDVAIASEKDEETNSNAAIIDTNKNESNNSNNDNANDNNSNHDDNNNNDNNNNNNNNNKNKVVRMTKRQKKQIKRQEKMMARREALLKEQGLLPDDDNDNNNNNHHATKSNQTTNNSLNELGNICI